MINAKAVLLDACINPVDFQELVLRTNVDGRWQDRRLWNIQKRIARGLHEARSVAVKGCHASGKTDVVSGAALQFFLEHPQGKVFVTAPTQRQIKTFVGEIELKRKSLEYAFRIPPCSALGLNVSEDHYILGASSSRAVNIQGLHGSDLLIVCDESPGILPEIWDAIEGIRSGGRVKIIKLGNPVVPSGPFFDDFQKPMEGQLNFTISAFDTPNFDGVTMPDLLAMSDAELDYSVLPYLIQRRWVKEMYYKWGPQHPKFLARVLGQFPNQDSWAVFNLHWIEQAKREPRPEELKAAVGHFIRIGIDPNGGGNDECAAAARVDGIILSVKGWPAASADEQLGLILHWLNDLKKEYGHKYPIGTIVVDVNGVGYHLAPRIAERGYDVVGFMASHRALDTEQFPNQKSEIYWIARGHFQDFNLSGLDDDDTQGQLSDIRYNETPRGIIIEPKDHTRKRTQRSPDRAEALIMSLMRVVPRSQHVEGSSGFRPGATIGRL